MIRVERRIGRIDDRRRISQGARRLVYGLHLGGELLEAGRRTGVERVLGERRIAGLMVQLVAVMGEHVVGRRGRIGARQKRVGGVVMGVQTRIQAGVQARV